MYKFYIARCRQREAITWAIEEQKSEIIPEPLTINTEPLHEPVRLQKCTVKVHRVLSSEQPIKCHKPKQFFTSPRQNTCNQQKIPQAARVLCGDVNTSNRSLRKRAWRRQKRCENLISMWHSQSECPQFPHMCSFCMPDPAPQSCVRVLDGDPEFLEGTEGCIPPYVALLLSLGSKYVPHSSPCVALRRSVHSLNGEIPELLRVLSWSLFHKLCPDASASNHFTLRSFSHRDLHVKTGSELPPVCVEKIDQPLRTSECAVTKLHHDGLLTLDQLDNTTLPRLGVGWNGSIQHDFCKDKLIIDSDKDGGSVVMSAQCYLGEQAAKLRETTSAGLPYYEMLSSCVDWVTEASLWFQIVRSTMLVCVPDNFEPVIMRFLNSFVKFSLPTFYLLAKTHKSMSVVN